MELEKKKISSKNQDKVCHIVPSDLKLYEIKVIIIKLYTPEISIYTNILPISISILIVNNCHDLDANSLAQISYTFCLTCRSYYKCTNPRCGAKKQVERSMDEPDTLIITYEGLHLHFAYPFFSNYNNNDSHTHQIDPPLKKAKKMLHERHKNDIQNEVSPKTLLEETNVPYHHQIPKSDSQQEIELQGLLEDVVPLEVRNPSRESLFNFSVCRSTINYSTPSILS